MKLLINSTHIDLLYLEKTKKHHLIESERFFSAQKYLPKPSSKTTQPPKKRKAQPTFFLTVSPGPLCPKELDMTLIALNTSKEQTGVLDLDGMAGQICVVFCFNAETCFFGRKTWRIWSWKLNIEWRCSHFVHALQSTYSWHIPTGFCWLKFRCSEKNGGGPRSKKNNTWIFFEGTLRIHVWEYSPIFMVQIYQSHWSYGEWNDSIHGNHYSWSLAWGNSCVFAIRIRTIWRLVSWLKKPPFQKNPMGGGFSGFKDFFIFTPTWGNDGMFFLCFFRWIVAEIHLTFHAMCFFFFENDSTDYRGLDKSFTFANGLFQSHKWIECSLRLGDSPHPNL